MTERELLMINAYNGGATASAAAKLAGYKQPYPCLNALKKYGLPRRAKCDYKQPFNERFFKTIDTEHKAYWLGFISADGCVSNSDLIIGLAEVDALHLEKLRVDLEYAKPIRVCRRIGGKTPGTTYAKLVVHSSNMVKDLLTHGVGPRKSLTLKPATTVPEHLLSHYWRGMFDGDGGLCETKKQNMASAWSMALCGTYPIVNSYLNFVKCFFNTTTKPRPQGKVWYTAFGGSRLVSKVCQLLYYGSTIYLDRKMDLVQRLWAKHPFVPTP